MYIYHIVKKNNIHLLYKEGLLFLSLKKNQNLWIIYISSKHNWTFILWTQQDLETMARTSNSLPYIYGNCDIDIDIDIVVTGTCKLDCIDKF